ncbi:DUF4269 domain-containing protein [Endozoicomonadaceae bacterium StTr2]
MSSKIDQAEAAVSESGIIGKLSHYSPEIVSTIFVELDTDSSDIDIVCSYQARDVFVNDLDSILEGFGSDTLKVSDDRVVGVFHFNGFMFEIFASETPVALQPGYRHYQIMKRLVAAGGPDFAEKIRKLKATGMKTEPAICHLLQIAGDPYTCILDIENWSDEALVSSVSKVK